MANKGMRKVKEWSNVRGNVDGNKVRRKIEGRNIRKKVGTEAK